MDAIQTTASNTLRRIRSEVAADSSVFRSRLLADGGTAGPEGPALPPAGYSDLFDAAAGGIPGLENYHQALEYIYEGFLLHQGRSRLLMKDATEFPVLAGDHMYARGLAAIASLEDLYCIEALAELIRACAFVQSEGLDPSLAHKAWSITTLRLAEHARNGGKHTDPDALAQMVWSSHGGEALDRRLEELLAAAPVAGRQDLTNQINDLEAGMHWTT
ncbi:MAG: hypothetical protein M1455_10720 [Actinobacteria bacterium]|nr:hypothetical protein [Actinomycetota bacterium]